MSYARAVGYSEAGKRIHKAGLAFQRRQRLASLPPLPGPEPEPEPEPAPPRETVKFARLRARIQAALDAHSDEARSQPPNLATIIAATAVEFDLHPQLLIGPSRRQEYIAPRHLACLLCHELTGASLPMIGRALGNRDHTTIIHGIRGARARMATDPELAGKYAVLRAKLEGYS